MVLIVIVVIFILLIKRAYKYCTVDEDELFNNGYTYVMQEHHSGRSQMELEMELEEFRWDHDSFAAYDKGADAALRVIYHQENAEKKKCQLTLNSPSVTLLDLTGNSSV
mgnify:CR=1 FL=1